MSKKNIFEKEYTISEVVQELTDYVTNAHGTIDNEDYVRKVRSLLPPLINNSLNADGGLFYFVVSFSLLKFKL